MSAEAGNKSIFDTLFGCCLGRRGQLSRSARRNDEHASGGQHGDEANERTPLIGGRGNKVDGQPRAETSIQGKGSSTEQSNDKRARSKKRVADAARLRAIRDQANDAFFYIDNSQLLPSSSSSRPINSYANASDSKRYVKGDATLHQNLVAQSDKAERLYRAALGTASSAEDAENLAISPQEREAPLSLVRQMKVTIREAAAEDSPSTPSNQQRNPSSSPQEAHARMGLDISEEIHHQSIAKLPSVHSLRTLRLGPKRSSISIGSEKMSSRDVISDVDDEDWSRGRTRSKRELAWIDVGQSEDVHLQSKPNVHDILQEEHKEASIEAIAGERVYDAEETDTMRDVQERLKATSSIADMWETNQDN